MVFIVYYLILCFAISSAYHHTHTTDTYNCVMDILVVNAALLRNRRSKMGGYTLDLNK